MAHEVNLFWASHQTHHSSEDYTLSTALRQSTSQVFTSMFVYLPLALFLPPSVYFTHKQFNLLYQFWIHTEVVDRMGILEWVLNTPSHHRVHHGRNPYCIDCNYAGVLIIWDRMFGTFQPELREEKVVYGLVHPLSSWDPFWAQVHHYVYILKRLVWGGKGEGLWFKLQFLFKGPGWSPGKPRLGCREDIPQVSPNEKPYDRSVPMWLNMYIAVHFAIILIIGRALGAIHSGLPYGLVLCLVAYCIFSVVCLGLFLDHHPRVVAMETARLGALLVALTQTPAILPGVAEVSVVLANPILLQVPVTASLALWAFKLLAGGHTPTTPTLATPKAAKTE
jgi:alkylglycerol monooxygenase